MELENQLPDLIKQTPKILPMVYADLAQPSVIKVGKALEAVFEFSTSFLLPLKLLNEKFKINFERNLNDYKRKIEHISEDKICDVNPQIGTPIIEKLTYITNEEIADLFTTLLSKATSVETLNQAHPGFIQFIERMSVDEARLIKYLKNMPRISMNIGVIPYIDFKGLNESETFLYIDNKVTSLTRRIEFLFPENIVSYIDNFISMGILEARQGRCLTNNEWYEQILRIWDYEPKRRCYVEKGSYVDVKYEKGYLRITELGELFINACTMDAS